MTFIDTNVLLDIVTHDPAWAEWSLLQLERAELAGPLRINDVVFAELSVRFDELEAWEAAVRRFGLVRTAPSPAALFLAGKAYLRYRRLGGLRSGVLPDFFIGAQAAVEGAPLLTRDPSRYRSYFPTLDLICP